MAKNTVTQAQRMRIAACLAARLTKNTDGTVTFEEGWNDQRIADELGIPLCINSVRRMRQELHGTLQSGSKVVAAEDVSALEDRIAALEDLLGGSEERFLRLEKRHKRLRARVAVLEDDGDDEEGDEAGEA